MTPPADHFDRRIVPDRAIELIVACQRLVPCRLAGGAALGGAYLSHRLSDDLDRAGYPPEEDLVLAVTKDGGMDPGVLAWLLDEFPVSPMPRLLMPLSVEELTAFRAALKERMRLAAIP